MGSNMNQLSMDEYNKFDMVVNRVAERLGILNPLVVYATNYVVTRTDMQSVSIQDLASTSGDVYTAFMLDNKCFVGKNASASDMLREYRRILLSANETTLPEYEVGARIVAWRVISFSEPRKILVLTSQFDWSVGLHDVHERLKSVAVSGFGHTLLHTPNPSTFIPQLFNGPVRGGEYILNGDSRKEVVSNKTGTMVFPRPIKKWGRR